MLREAWKCLWTLEFIKGHSELGPYGLYYFAKSVRSSSCLESGSSPYANTPRSPPHPTHSKGLLIPALSSIEDRQTAGSPGSAQPILISVFEEGKLARTFRILRPDFIMFISKKF